MIPPTKTFLSEFLVLAAIVLTGCAGRSGPAAQANTNASQATTTAKSSGPGARLDRFVGSWGGYAGRSSAVSGQVGIDSRFMNIVVKQSSPGAVALEGDVWQAKGGLRYDAGSDKYLLSFEAEDFPKVSDLPMKFSEADGFSGETTLTHKGKEAKATATIKDDKGQSQWGVKVNQGKDLWSVTIRLGKDK